MATSLNSPDQIMSFSFSDFPEDVQLCILSFLTLSDLSTFACTSKRFDSLCKNDSKLWFSLCDRKWGSKTQIKKWAKGKIHYKNLYKTLIELETLIGFWRRCGQTQNTSNSPPQLIFFEWGPGFISGSRISPFKRGDYKVIKVPFLWVSVRRNGEVVSFIDLECRSELSPQLTENLVNNLDDFGVLENELVPVSVNFMGKSHLIVEENVGFWFSSNGVAKGNATGEEYGVSEDASGSPPDRVMSEIYQYFANRTSPGGSGATRRQKRREKERQGRRRWEPEHFLKIESCSPTPARPLQGLWKGIGDDMNLDFYLVRYDDIGGISCRTVGDPYKPFTGYAPIFWTSNTTFIESPLTPEEDFIYASRVHLRPDPTAADSHGHPSFLDNEEVSRIVYINSSYDLVIPDLAETIPDPRQAEGRIWQYENGTFGFGFLRNNWIVDLKHIACNGCLLHTVEPCNG